MEGDKESCVKAVHQFKGKHVQRDRERILNSFEVNELCKIMGAKISSSGDSKRDSKITQWIMSRVTNYNGGKSTGVQGIATAIQNIEKIGRK